MNKEDDIFYPLKEDKERKVEELVKFVSNLKPKQSGR